MIQARVLEAALLSRAPEGLWCSCASPEYAPDPSSSGLSNACTQDGDIINIDVTVYLDGYHGDTSRTFLVGNVDDEARKLVAVRWQREKVSLPRSVHFLRRDILFLFSRMICRRCRAWC